MPVFFELTLGWYPFIYGPIVLTAVLILEGHRRRTLLSGWKLTVLALPVTIPVSAALAAVEYRIIQPGTGARSPSRRTGTTAGRTPIDEIQYQMAQDQCDDHRRDIEVATDDPLSEKGRQADRHQRDERVEQAGRPEELVDVREQAESGQRQRPRLREQVAAQHVRRRQRDEQVREEVHA